MHLITSMNASLYEQYGKNMISDFRRFAGADMRLVVIFEGEQLVREPSDSVVDVIPLRHPEHERFVKFFGGLHEARGLQITFTAENRVNLEWLYTMDAMRFAFKIFAIDQALENIPSNEMFGWIDADVRCLKPFAATDLTDFFPDSHQIMSYLGRDRFPPEHPYSECGFLGFNPNHPQTRHYLDRVKSIYTTGEIFSFPQRHDCWVWDTTRREFETRGNQFKNISGPAAALDHPFINTGLGKFFDHLKGPQRKAAGKSSPLDYRLR